jgi:PIN domain nuclease of toxin-antitoxin system
MSILPITFAHLEETWRLPDIHGDPFDRLLVAQATLEGMTLVTGDQWIRRYPVSTAW